MKTLTIFTDGAAKNNPGPAGIGVVFLREDGTLIDTHKEYIGEKTNNVAEYLALILALDKAKDHKAEKIIVNLDSKLLVEQINGNYKVKDPTLKKLFWQVRELILELGGNIEFCHIPREKNYRADKLANQAIYEKLQGSKKS